VLRTLLLTVLMSLSISIPAVFAEDKPQESTTSDTPAAPAAVETRDVDKFFDDTFNNMKEDLETAKTDGKKAY